MQSVSYLLEAALNKANPVYGKTVLLYRKIWNGAAYEFEDTGIDITGQIQNAGRIMWKFDKEGFNVWSLANTTLTLRNEKQQWKQDNPVGHFPSGYLLRGSKVVINAGAQLYDGTFEKPYVFIGYIDSDPIRDTDSKLATITLTGPMSVFSDFNAEGISNLITDESHPYTAPGVTDYNTVNTGVAASGLIVKRGTTASGPDYASVILPTTGYTISGNGKKGVPLTISLVSALVATESIWVTYKYWHTDKTYEWLVEQVLSLCGITNYIVSPAVFASNIENTWRQTTKADFDSDNLVNIDTFSTLDSFKMRWILFDDFSDLNYTTNPIWTVRASGGTASAAAGYLRLTSNSASSELLSSPTTMATKVKSWRWRGQVQWNIVGASPFSTTGYWFFTYSYYATSIPNGYGICYDPISNSVVFNKQSGGSITLIATLVSGLPTGWHEWMVTWNESINTFKVYFDNVVVGTIVDSTYTTAINFAVKAVGTSDDSVIIDIDDIFIGYSYDNITAFDGDNPSVLESIVYDMGASLTAFTKLSATYTTYGGTVKIYTYTADDAAFTMPDPAGWLLLSPTGSILSALKRYIKFKVVLTASAWLDSPIVDDITITYYTNTTVIDLVDLTGMSCSQVLNVCAEHPCYEYGFNASNVFVYRPRITTIGTVIDLKSSTNTEKLINIVDGIDRIKNRVVANFGIYSVAADTTGDPEPNSKTKYGDKEYRVSSTSLLPADNVNIAYAIAPTILAYTKQARKRCQAVCKSLPQLELGDLVFLYYEEPTAFKSWKWGDTCVSYGDTDLVYHDELYKSNRLAFFDVKMRIEGIEFDWWGGSPDTGWKTILDLVEVLD